MTDAADGLEYACGIKVRFTDIYTQHVVNNRGCAHYLTEARVNYCAVHDRWLVRTPKTKRRAAVPD